VKEAIQVGEVDIVSFFYLLYLVDETLKGILKCMGEVHATIFEADFPSFSFSFEA